IHGPSHDGNVRATRRLPHAGNRIRGGPRASVAVPLQRSPPMRLARLALVSALLACGSNKPAAQPPSAPTGLAATGGNGQISLTWNAVQGASYNVLRGDASGRETQHATSATASYTDGSLPAATTYFYVVQAVKDSLTSGN